MYYPNHAFCFFTTSSLFSQSLSLTESEGLERERRAAGRECIGSSTFMESVNGKRCVVPSISKQNLKPAEPLSRLQEGISSILSRWNGLQLAINNQWGGQDSLYKSHQLAADILYWLSHSKAPLRIEDLENLLHESMLLSFNTEIEDGSIEEVAEQLIIMHEDQQMEEFYYENAMKTGRAAAEDEYRAIGCDQAK